MSELRSIALRCDHCGENVQVQASEHPTPEQRAIMEVLCQSCALEREADEILRAAAAEGGET